MKIKLFTKYNDQYYIKNMRPRFIFEIKITKYAPVVLEKPWVINWTYESRGWTEVPMKWHDRQLSQESPELNGYKTWTSLNTHNWCQLLAQMAHEIAYFRKIPVVPLEASFFFWGKKLFTWRVNK